MTHPAENDVAEVGTCALCGQEMIRTADDCWHPYNVETACPPQPSARLGTSADGNSQWQEFYASGLRTGRPGREHFRSVIPPASTDGAS